MAPKVYIETSILSYLTARPSRDIVIAGHQQITHDWWQTSRAKFDLLASQLVIQEASAGNQEAARERLAVLATITLLEITHEAVALAQHLVKAGAVPEQAAPDALHIAIAVTNGTDYLLTWNHKHLANAALRNKIETICRAAGYNPVIICTPEDLLEG